jgi:hypothetical protein
MCFDSASLRAEHRLMERLDHTRTVVAALVHLGDAGFDQQTNDRAGADHVVLSRKVDALVDGYLVTFNTSARQTAAMRKILADEFLAAAPFTELSYRVWRRIMRDGTDLPEPPVRVTSELLLPAVDFVLPAVDFVTPADFVPQSAPARKPLDGGRRSLRSFFGYKNSDKSVGHRARD